MENLNAFISRLAIAAITSAVFCAGAVYFVVDQSLRGMENSLDQTNLRITDLRVDANDIQDDLENVGNSVEIGFAELSSQLSDISEQLSASQTDTGRLALMTEEQLQGLILAYGSLNRLLVALEPLASGNPEVQQQLVNLKGEIRTNCVLLTSAGMKPVGSVLTGLDGADLTHPCLN